jgi:hypothetical protein
MSRAQEPAETAQKNMPTVWQNNGSPLQTKSRNNSSKLGPKSDTIQEWTNDLNYANRANYKVRKRRKRSENLEVG